MPLFGSPPLTAIHPSVSSSGLNEGSSPGSARLESPCISVAWPGGQRVGVVGCSPVFSMASRHGRRHAVLQRVERQLHVLPVEHAGLPSGPALAGPSFCPRPLLASCCGFVRNKHGLSLKAQPMQRTICAYGVATAPSRHEKTCGFVRLATIFSAQYQVALRAQRRNRKSRLRRLCPVSHLNQRTR